jgi:hypothetical protein
VPPSGKAADGAAVKHRWNHCVCIDCGAKRDEGHVLSPLGGGPPSCRCTICGEEAHDWHACECYRCGRDRHTWQSYGSDGMYLGRRCTTCGEDQPRTRD